MPLDGIIRLVVGPAVQGTRRGGGITRLRRRRMGRGRLRKGTRLRLELVPELFEQQLVCHGEDGSDRWIVCAWFVLILRTVEYLYVICCSR